MRTKQILFRASENEYLKIKEMATVRKMRTATFIRNALLHGITPAIPSINQAALTELHKIGINLNQLAKSYNSTGTADLDSIKRETGKLRIWLIEARKPA